MRGSFCLHGEPTGDETPLYLDDDRERSTCPVCGHVRYESWCAECNGRRIEAGLAARAAAEADGTGLTLVPQPMRLAA